jgi:hypothetical protein
VTVRARIAPLALVGALSWVGLGCGSSATSSPERASGAGRAGEGAVVAAIDGEPILADDVARLAAREGVEPAEALAELERWVLLAHEAERRGLGRTRAARLAERRAMAQLVLRDLEREVSEAQITDAMVEATYEAERGALAEPERRLLSWVRIEPRLGARLGADARALAEGLLERMRTEGPEPVLRELGEAPPASDRYTFSVEEGLLVEPDPSGASVLRAAFFAPSAPGAMDAPIVTPRGVYAAYLVDLLPPRTPSLAQVEARLRAESLERRRAAAVQALLAERRARASIRFDEEALAPVFDPARGR